MTKIGQINKPDAALYKDKKKIYFLRNLYLPQNATDKYREFYNRYWKEAEEHLDKLEVAGKVSKIFCESIYMSGEESMKVLAAMNSKLEQLVRKKMEEGAEFLPMEDQELFGAYIDWNNCLVMTRTEKVHTTIHKFLKEASEERFNHIKSVLEESIKDKEAVLLIMRGGDRKHLDLPKDSELFLITPPSYEDLQQYVRDFESEKEFWRK